MREEMKRKKAKFILRLMLNVVFALLISGILAAPPLTPR
jgi:hypothetical protein